MSAEQAQELRLKLVEQYAGVGSLRCGDRTLAAIPYRINRYQGMALSGLPIPGLHRIEGMLALASAPEAAALVGADVTLELLRRNEFRTDVYVRPLAYKAARSIKVALHDLRSGFGMFAFPIGAYLPTSGLSARTATWRRTSDDSIPARGKLTGAYINTALAVDDAHDADADEAIFLTRDGHVSEGGSANLFMVRDGQLITPSVTDDILEGITRDSIMTIAREELGLTVQERAIDRTELFVADEVFFCGTGAQVAP